MTRLLKLLLWIGIGALGAAAVAVLAFARGEPVNALWIVTAGLMRDRDQLSLLQQVARDESSRARRQPRHARARGG